MGLGDFDSLGGPPSPAPSLGVNTDLNSVANVAGLGNLINQTVADSQKTVFKPWQASQVISRFFPYLTIDGSRWDQLFPYRLLVIDSSNKNNVVNGDTAYNIKVGVTPGTSSALITYDSWGSQWVFQLPITPQQLSIVDQYAINTSATLRGVLEEHSGVRFKTITCSGSMGVWTQKPSVAQPPQSPTILESVFGGTIASAQNLIGQVQGVINTVTTGHPSSAPASIRPPATSPNYSGTGYYQALALQQFLEQYAEAKKNPKNAGWRLVFHIPKQNQAFVVTPATFTWSQSANKPMEINYNLQFKAWRRIDLAENLFQLESSVQPISPGILATILNTISQARNVTSSALNLIGAVRSDLESPLNVLRQTTLFVKDLAGVALAVADLPFQLQKDYASAIKDSINTLSPSILSNSSNPQVTSSVNSIKASTASSEGLTLSAVSGGQIGNPSAQASSIDPSNNVFQTPEANFELLSQVPISSLTLTPAQQNTIDNVIQVARQTTVADLKSFRTTILQLALQLSNNFGAGSAFYSKVYGLPAPTPRIQPMTLDEYDILQSLYDSIQAYDILTATQDIDFLNKQTNMEYVAGLADASNIEFHTSISKVLAPVPFGLTVEAIALRYLGDAQRWLEIVTLNNLRDPYIDEDGFQLPLLSNATGRQLTVSDINNLYIGQRVLIQSSTQSPTARTILNIDTLSSTSFLLTLDGLPNLDPYVLADQAYVQAYLPGTVNSQQKIFIPSNLPIPNDPNIVIPASAAVDPLSGMSKVDLLLTDSGDVAVNNFGDFRLAYGITNIIQALKIKIGTVLGTIPTHPDFGLGIKVGIINSELNTSDVFNSMNKLIQQDPRFQGLSNLQVTLNGPVLSINMGVILAGKSGVYPLTFNLVA